jgi:hypothetical protein
VKKRVLSFRVALLFAIVAGAALANVGMAQRARNSTPPAKPTPAAKANDLLAALPASDAVALVKFHQLLDEGLTKILADSPEKLAETNAEIEKFKTKTGIDARSLDQVAVSMRYSYPREGITKVDTATLARGSFKPAAFVAAGRAAGAGKYREEKYKGLTIYVFTLDQQLKIFGVINTPLHDLAIALLEPNLLAMGNPENVRRLIDSQKTRATGNAELIALTTQDPNALIGFGGNVTPALLGNLQLGNEAIAKDVSAIRQVYGTVNLTAKDLEMLLAARTTDSESAKNLSDTLEGLKQLGAFFVGRLPAPKGTVARTALDNLKITTQGNELRIRTAVAQVQLGPLMKGM